MSWITDLIIVVLAFIALAIGIAIDDTVTGVFGLALMVIVFIGNMPISKKRISTCLACGCDDFNELDGKTILIWGRIDQKGEVGLCAECAGRYPEFVDWWDSGLRDNITFVSINH